MPDKQLDEMLGGFQSNHWIRNFQYYFSLFRFADILGLELNMVKVFTDEIPRVPISAFIDLDLDPREYQVRAQDPLISQLQDTVT